MCVWVCTCMCGRIDIRWMCTVFFIICACVFIVCVGTLYVFFNVFLYELLSIRVCFCVYFWKYSIIIHIHVEFMKYIKKNIRSWLIQIQYSHFYLFLLLFSLLQIFYLRLSQSYVLFDAFIIIIPFFTQMFFFFSIKQNGNPNHTDIDRGFTHFDIRS